MSRAELLGCVAHQAFGLAQRVGQIFRQRNLAVVTASSQVARALRERPLAARRVLQPGLRFFGSALLSAIQALLGPTQGALQRGARFSQRGRIDGLVRARALGALFSVGQFGASVTAALDRVLERQASEALS